MEFTIKTSKREELLDIRKQVESAVSRVEVGICNVFTLHSSAAILINENWDPSICNDILSHLAHLIPRGAGYEHDAIDGNADSHIKASLLGPSETIPIRGGKLLLGKWQSITLAEFDGPRERKVIVTILKSG